MSRDIHRNGAGEGSNGRASGAGEDANARAPDRLEATIVPYRNGPYLIRGPFRMLDQDGNEIEVERKTIALCRCGRSQTRPFCDGTHTAVRFRAPSGPEAQRPGSDDAGPAESLPPAG